MGILPKAYLPLSFLLFLLLCLLLSLAVFCSFGVFPPVILGHTTEDLGISVQSICASLISNILQMPGCLALLSHPASPFFFFCHHLLLVFLYMYMFTVYMYVQPPAFLAISHERPLRVILAPLSG